MTSTLRVSEFKGIKSSGQKNRDGKPKKGTRLREMYDGLRRGEIVQLGGNIMSLRDMYGMEILPVYEEGRRGCLGSRLVGEWEGPYFVPVERIAPDEDVVGD